MGQLWGSVWVLSDAELLDTKAAHTAADLGIKMKRLVGHMHNQIWVVLRLATWPSLASHAKFNALGLYDGSAYYLQVTHVLFMLVPLPCTGICKPILLGCFTLVYKAGCAPAV